MEDSRRNGGDESSIQQKKPPWLEVRTPGKRIRIGSSPETTPQVQTRPPERLRQQQHIALQQNTVSSAIKISPITVRFESGQLASDREIGADLVDPRQNMHKRKLNITARFGYQKCLLIFANDCNTFEDLLDQSHWPSSLKGIAFKISIPPHTTIGVFNRNSPIPQKLNRKRS